MHPLNNLRVLKYLVGDLQVTEQQKTQWIQHWIGLGLKALEAQIATSGRSGRFSFGDSPTLADCCLIPQLFSAERFNVDLGDFPSLLRISRACSEMEAFRAAHPARQPDTE